MNTGIFISRCGGAFEGLIDLDKLAGLYSTFPSVRILDDFFSNESQGVILDEISAHQLDSIILAGDSHYFYSQIRNGDLLFKRLADRFKRFGEHGINQNKIEIVNLKNMAAVPHKGGLPHLVFEKAKLLIDAGLEKLKTSHDIKMVEIAPRKTVAVVGANASGIIISQLLLDEGYKVYLLNRRKELALSQQELEYLQPTLSYIIRHPRIVVYNDVETKDFYGYPGDYILKLTSEGQELELLVGAVVLSLQHESSLIKSAQSVFHVDVAEDGSLAARDEVTARSLTLDRGIFVVNPTKTESGIDISQHFTAADATASMVINLLNRNEIFHPVKVSEVKPELCSGCGACVKTCMFEAVSLIGSPAMSHIDPRRCRGCGNCVTACPADARDLVSTPNSSLYAAIDTFAQFGKGSGSKRVLMFACDGCGYRCLNAAADAGLSWPVGLMPLRVVCGGQIDTQMIMHAFVAGFDGVLLTVCGEGCCHNIIGNVDLERRANLFREILESRGIGQERMKIISTCSRKGKDCVDAVEQFWAQFDDASQATCTIVLKK